MTVNWTVEPITKKQADFIITSRHYSRRAPNFRKAFALVDEHGLIDGVVVYGNGPKPIADTARNDIGVDAYELTRLVIQTTKPNAASFLVGRSLRMLPQPSLIVSYADTEWGHSGIVYQATNWVYTGSTKSHDGGAFVIEGERVHSRSLTGRGISNPVAWAKANGIEMVPPMRKHRYFYLNGNSRQKKDMLAKLRYPVIDQYPKSDKRTYDAGEHIVMHVKDAMADGFGGLA